MNADGRGRRGEPRRHKDTKKREPLRSSLRRPLSCDQTLTPDPYFELSPKKGKSLFNSSFEGRRPYSQISNASALLTF